MTEGLIDDEQGGFRARSCVDQIFTIKEIGEKAREKMNCVCRFYGLGNGLR